MSEFKLEKNSQYSGVPGQLLLVILDGVGLYRGRSDGYDGNALDLANTPNLDRLFAEAPAFLELKAHGSAVGLPSEKDMGNSEVGHNAMGAGRVFAQGAKLVGDAIATGALFAGPVWRGLVEEVRSRALDGEDGGFVKRFFGVHGASVHALPAFNALCSERAPPERSHLMHCLPSHRWLFGREGSDNAKDGTSKVRVVRLCFSA